MCSAFAQMRNQKSFVFLRVPSSGVTLLWLGLSFHCGEKVGERLSALLKWSQWGHEETHRLSLVRSLGAADQSDQLLTRTSNPPRVLSCCQTGLDSMLKFFEDNTHQIWKPPMHCWSPWPLAELQPTFLCLWRRFRAGNTFQVFSRIYCDHCSFMYVNSLS